MRRYLCVALPAVFLSACTTFDGVPKPVISTADALAMVGNDRPPDAISKMATLTEPARTDYRNRVVTSYLVALDARYEDFHRSLARGMKGGNIGFDLLGLGLTGLASTAGKSASDLAAAATVAAGGRASINRELYFEKALPSLLSLMDSKRLSVRSDILKGLSQSEQLYTLQDAFADLWRYQSAASIDGAIQQAAAAAAEEAKQSDVDFEKAVELCRVDDEVAIGRKRLIRAVEGVRTRALKDDDTTGARATLQKVAIETGTADAKAPATADEVRGIVQTAAGALRGICTSQQLSDFEARLVAAGVKTDE